jgi:hypothetical protein
LALLTDMLSGFKYFSEAPRLARKCGTHRSDNPVRALNPPSQGRGKPAKPGLLHPLVWIPFYDTVSEILGLQSRVGSIAGEFES